MRFRTRVVALSALIVAADAAAASAQFAYSFTSGPRPIGDGANYPRSINPARRLPSGAGPTTYFGPGRMGFVNTNANPAYFDANNLLTRPSKLISGEAFWLDPKIGNYPSPGGGASFPSSYVGLNLSGIDNADFGFDLAIASVSGPVQPYVQFQVQDDAHHVAVGYLYFNEPVTPANQIFEASQVGQFYTLSSPHPAYEGRFSLNNDRLQQMMRDQNSDVTGDSNLLFFDMNLLPFSTGGGTTQVAIDNVVYGGASAPEPSIEPSYLPPIGPIGANTPQYIGYAEAEPANYAGDTHHVDLSDFPPVDGMEAHVGSVAFDAADAQSARATATGASIVFGAPADPEEPEIVGHEVSHVVQGGGNATTPSPGLPSNATPLGDKVGVNNVQDVTPTPQPAPLNGVARAATADAIVGGDSPSPQLIEVSSVLPAHPTDPKLQQAFAFAAQQSASPTQQIIANATIGTATRLALLRDLALTFDDVRPGAPAPGGTVQPPDYVDPNSDFYVNYTIQQYLVRKAAYGEPMYLGDSGSVVTPFFDAAGNIISYTVRTWLVTDQSGVFVPSYIAVPEPAAASGLAVLLAGLGRRRRP